MSTETSQQHEWRVGNLDCDNEASQICRGLERLPGIKELRVFPKSAKVIVSIDETILKPEAVKSTLTQMGFPILPSRSVAEAPKPWKNPKVITSVISGVILSLTYLLESVAGLPPLYASKIFRPPSWKGLRVCTERSEVVRALTSEENNSFCVTSVNNNKHET